MKKRTLLIILTLSIFLSACGGGDVSEAGRRIGTCELFRKSEVADAMDVVEDHFRKEFDDCTLIELVYDEETTAEKAARLEEQYGKETVVLLSSFEVDGTGGDGSLNPNYTYKNYQWVLVKTLFGWELKDWGYA